MEKFTDIAIIHLLNYKNSGSINHLYEAERIIGMLKTEIENPDESWKVIV